MEAVQSYLLVVRVEQVYVVMIATGHHKLAVLPDDLPAQGNQLPAQLKRQQVAP